MKRKLALLVCIAMLLSVGLYGCKQNDVAEPEIPAPVSHKEISKTTDSNSMSDGTKKDILRINSSYATPNYEYQLYQADDVIYGEVIEELESFYTNPNRDDYGITNAWITPYVIQIEKSYKGLLKEGDTVVVSAWNKVGIYPEDEEKYEIVTNQKEFYLQKGQRGVFMVSDTKVLKTDDGQPMYEVVYQNEGVFTPKETGIATMSEEAKTVYDSPSFEITLDQIPADIQKADQLYKEGNEVSAQTEEK